MGRSLIFLFLFMLSVCFSVKAQIRFPEGNYRTFQKEAKKSNSSYLVFFYTDWCKHCRFIIDSTFTDAKVKAAMERDYLLTAINMDKQKTWGRVYNIKSFPAIILFDPRGHELARVRGSVTREEMLDFLGSASQSPVR
ncbi:MAG: thioredoxin family protein [Bacteroidia bacterium]